MDITAGIILDDIQEINNTVHKKLILDYPYFVRVKYYKGMDEWCDKNFGIWQWPGDNNCWCSSYQGYYFKNEKDFVLFTLRYI